MLDLRGNAVRSIGVQREAQSGQALRLSIDLRLQYMQHEELKRAIAMTGAASGSITTLDSHTGEVLAVSSYPTYNPNNRDAMTPGSDRNRAFVDVYEPGSTMKPLTLVAALESGRYTPETVIDTSPGRIRVGRKVLPDPRNYGEISLSRVIQKSSQVGITRVSLDIGHQPVWEVMRRFGLGQPPGTGFPGESTGLLPHRERWRPIEQVTLAFGYGLTVTPLQLARAYSVFASGGVLPEVSLLARDKGSAAGGASPAGRRVISPELAAQVRRVLQAVTEDDGTATRAQVDGYTVGGKTGTVHKVGAGGYQEDQYVAWFVGLAPVDAPRFVTVVLLDRPQGDNYGGSAAAAPVFARVARGTLHLLGVPPDTAAPAEPGPALADGATAVAMLARGGRDG
jgi:cell division protein FtsI (penicillin-binding protein 3)